MATAVNFKRNVRAGIVDNEELAEQIVTRLRDAGFGNDELRMVSSNEHARRRFREIADTPSGSHTPAASAGGAILGLVIGACAGAFMAIAFEGSVPMLICAALAPVLGIVIGGFVGAMLTRGVEHEAEDYYDQAVVDGQILIAAEVEEEAGQEERLAEAERILSEAGAHPLPLPEG